jgi:hypothetical protein
MKKLKLKEDEDGNKTSEVNGIRAGCKIMKTRYAKPFEDIQIKIPYEQGMSPYSGLFDLMEKRKLVSRTGNSYVYTLLDGTELKAFRKKWEANEDNYMDKVMADISERDKLMPIEPVEAFVDDSTDPIEESQEVLENG